MGATLDCVETSSKGLSRVCARAVLVAAANPKASTARNLTLRPRVPAARPMGWAAFADVQYRQFMRRPDLYCELPCLPAFASSGSLRKRERGAIAHATAAIQLGHFRYASEPQVAGLRRIVPQHSCDRTKPYDEHFSSQTGSLPGADHSQTDKPILEAGKHLVIFWALSDSSAQKIVGAGIIEKLPASSAI